MTGREAYITLKEELKARNCLRQYLINTKASGLKNKALKKTSPEETLQASFSWPQSPESHSFWEAEFYILQKKHTLPF
jgi:hypothetical protein